MSNLRRFTSLLFLFSALLAFALLVAPPATRQTEAAAATVVVESLVTTGDARIQGGSPDVNFNSGFLYLSTLNGHRVLTQFELLALPANASVDAAELQLDFTGVLTGPNDVEVGQALATWDENSLTWNNQPAITWGGPVQTVSANGLYSWDVTGIVAQWHSGALDNHGFALRGNGGDLVAANSKETGGTPPTLVVTYSVPPPEGARPDLGDAADSSNHLGLNNTAYVAGNVLGRFPTVWDVPPGQAAGPRHDNLTTEAILGQYLSREAEADSGADQDGANNILDGGADNADNDRGDDGWRNRTIKFFPCRKQTLTVRVSKAPTATRHRMYLNVWFDGNRDGDWADITACTPPAGGPAQAGYEWIVQDYIVDLTAIPAGGFADFQIDTERVLNNTPGNPHWLRFTLSEERAVQPPSGAYPDGRGPHPDGAQGSFRFGETEDVRQLPPPPGEDGTLVLEKRILDADPSVPYGGTVTYQIRLRHEGGSQPVAAQIRDELDYPLHLLPQIVGGDLLYVNATSPTGGAAPLQGDLTYDVGASLPRQVVSWQGTLAPNSEILLSFDVHVHPLCTEEQSTETIDNVAYARPLGGNETSATVTFLAQCAGFSADDIEIQWPDLPGNTLELTEYDDFLARSMIHNQHNRPVTLALTGELETNVPGAGPIQLPGARTITLGPDETQTLALPLSLQDVISDELALTEELAAVARLRFCFVFDEPYPAQEPDQNCPDGQQFPNLVGEGEPITITVRPDDLGDAPDGTNHFAAPMTAYPGTPANFPTVFDPATGLPQGPKHLHPRPLHLGPGVSREGEADVGPDDDPLNNIVPATNNPDNDYFDDGANPNLWPLNDCQTANLPVQLFISPQAVNWFQQQEEPAYLNVWLDANRDGDWADGSTCPGGQSAVEHIVVDYAVDVVALGAGLTVINVPTDLVPWPAALAQQPFWARVTLGERKSNKTLLFGGLSYGDGRGFAFPFRLGETEDYLAYPEGAEGAGPDVAVDLTGEAGWDLAQQPGGMARMGAVPAREYARFKIKVANLGSRAAHDALLTFQIPARFQGMQPTLLRAPGIPPENITVEDEWISFLLPYVEQQNLIILGWETALGAASAPSTANVEVAVNGDLDLSNNQATATVTTTLPQPLLAFPIVGAKGWGTAETTCRSSVEVAVVGVAGRTVTIFVDGEPAGSTLLGEEPVYYSLANLGSGPHHIQARYGAQLRLPAEHRPLESFSLNIINVDPGLPIDPLSLTFADSQGRSFHPPTLGFSGGASQEGGFAGFLQSGETYEVGIDSCSDELNQTIRLDIADGTSNTLALHDDDGDGRYTGSFTYNPVARTAVPHRAADESLLQLIVVNGGLEQSFDLAVESSDPGIVRDASTGQRLAGATITALAAAPDETHAALFAPWPAAALGQPNPQLSGPDGAYSVHVPGGRNRLAVRLDGYQPYRSWDVAGPAGLLAPDINLSPEISGPAAATIYITENGFEPAVLSVAPGSVVEWVNVDLDEHGAAATGGSWESGVLASGGSYRLRLDEAGSYSYRDNAHPLNRGTIVVEGNQILLPLLIH